MRYVAPTVMCCWLRKSKWLFEQRSRRRHITVAVLALAQPHRQAWFEPIDLQKVGKLSNRKSEDRVWALQVGSRAIFLCGAQLDQSLLGKMFSVSAPHNPGRHIKHTVPRIEVATDGRSNGPREPAPEDSAPPRGRNVTMGKSVFGCGGKAIAARYAEPNYETMPGTGYYP